MRSFLVALGGAMCPRSAVTLPQQRLLSNQWPLSDWVAPAQTGSRALGGKLLPDLSKFTLEELEKTAYSAVGE